MLSTQNDTKNLLTALKSYIGNTKSSFSPDEILNAIAQSDSNILKAISKSDTNILNGISESEGKIITAIDAAVFSKSMLEEILSGTCENLIYDNVAIIGDSVFDSQRSLKKIDLPNCVSIGVNAFHYCTGLTSVNIPRVSTIKSSAFSNCINITSMYLPYCNTINSNGFDNCRSLAEVYAPNVYHLNERAFTNCNSLVSFDILTAPYVGNNVFSGCTGLKKVFISQNCRSIDPTSGIHSPFNGCTNSEFKIFCEATEKPSGWSEYWNYISSSAQATVVWGATHEDYEAY